MKTPYHYKTASACMGRITLLLFTQSSWSKSVIVILCPPQNYFETGIFSLNITIFLSEKNIRRYGRLWVLVRNWSLVIVVRSSVPATLMMWPLWISLIQQGFFFQLWLPFCLLQPHLEGRGDLPYFPFKFFI